MKSSPNYLIQTREESAESQLSSDIKYVYIHKGEIFLMLKIQHWCQIFKVSFSYAPNSFYYPTTPADGEYGELIRGCSNFFRLYGA